MNIRDVDLGDPVWYWARRKGERRARIVRGEVMDVDLSGKFARVRLEGDTMVPVQSIAVMRLHKSAGK